MTRTITLQEKAVRKTLHDSFEPHIDMSDLEGHHREEQLKSARTSRALAALSAAANAGITITEACRAVVDESGDEGLDAFAISRIKREVYLIQAKTGNGSPSPTEVQKFLAGIELFLNCDWESLGPKMRRWQEDFEEMLSDEFKVIAIFTSLGDTPPNQTARRKVERFVQKTNHNGEILDFRFENLRDNFKHRTAGNPDTEIKATLRVEQWLSLGNYQSEIVAIVNGDQLAQLAIEYGDRLFDKNIRTTLGTSSTNEIIFNSIKNTPKEFWYFNNGITIVAASIASDKVQPQPGTEKFEITNISVVNGAQTVGALAQAKNNGMPLDEVFVTVRVVSTKHRESDFEQKVTRFTNTQNRIGGQEFVALDPRHQIWKEALLVEGIEYLYKSGSNSDEKTSNSLSFRLDDATRALACLTGVEEAALVKRNIGAFYNDLEKGPYKKIFCDERTAEEIGNAIRFWFTFSSIYSDLSKKRTNTHHTIARNANFFCCSMLMRIYQDTGHTFNDFSSDPSTWISENTDLIDRLIEHCIDYFDNTESVGQPAAFFKRNDVRDLRREIISRER